MHWKAEMADRITVEPGVYPDMPSETYIHADALSYSSAKKLLPPSCPAKFRHDRDNPSVERKSHFDFGSAAHKTLTGVGPEIVVVDAPDWRGKAAKEAKKQAEAEGKIPLLPADAAAIDGMMEALKADPIASALLSDGVPEAALIWDDPRTGVRCKARIDWLRNRVDGKRLIVPDYKSTASAYPLDWGRSAYNFGYLLQEAWFLAGIKALGLCSNPAFVFIAQERTAPYLISTMETDLVAKRIGENHRIAALDIYQWCVENDHWPGYSEEIEEVSLPRWAEIAEGV